MLTSIPEPSTARRAVELRDRLYDGRFVYGVSSTRIFCRPSCPSRRPTRARLEFFATPAEAESAGYRACRRCRPGSDEASRSETAVARACEYLTAHADRPITLAALAAMVGLSPFHLQRAFKRVMGISPRAFRDAQRRHNLTTRLREGDSVSRATYEAGFGSSSRVYERALGMSPATLRKRGAGQRIQFSIVPCALGRLLVAYTEHGVCAVAIGDDDNALERSFREDFSEAKTHRAGSSIHEWIVAIVRGLDENAPIPAVPLDARGTAFQWRVWNALQQIPRGTTLSYSEVARRIGSPTAVRAVARACATNPVALVIPCHRVVREDGDMGGYRWGVDRKRKLLESERGRDAGVRNAVADTGETDRTNEYG